MAGLSVEIAQCSLVSLPTFQLPLCKVVCVCVCGGRGGGGGRGYDCNSTRLLMLRSNDISSHHMVECVTTSSAISKGYLFLCAEQDLACYITVWFPRYRTKILQIIVQHLYSIVLYVYCTIY